MLRASIAAYCAYKSYNNVLAIDQDAFAELRPLPCFAA